MEYARTVRLLSTLQLELEYAEIEEGVAAAGGQPRTQEEVERDAAEAAQWFTAERFAYVCACQRYYEHNEGEWVRGKGGERWHHTRRANHTHPSHPIATHPSHRQTT